MEKAFLIAIFAMLPFKSAIGAPSPIDLITQNSRQISQSRSPLFGDSITAQIISPAESADTLSFQTALSLSTKNNPQLQAALYNVRLTQAESIQQSMSPNPELDIEVENFAGTGEFGGLGVSESVISIGQQIEISGKRWKRMEAADYQTNLAIWDYRVKELEIYSAVAECFIQLIAAQNEIFLTKELLSLSENFHTSVDKRVSAGKLSPSALSRAGVEVMRTSMELKRTERILEEKRIQMAALLGENNLSFSVISGELVSARLLPPLEKLTGLLENNPKLARWSTERAYRNSILNLANANRIMDPVISAGIKNIQDTGDIAFSVGVSIPLPVFNRNEGSILKATESITQSNWEESSVRNQLQSELESAYIMLIQLEDEIRDYENKLLPESELAYDIVSKDYTQGKFGFLEVLDAERMLFDIKHYYLDLLLEYNLAIAYVEILINEKLPGS
jgi:outer membrane protein, heavy metal efflux system